jgi:vacuolar-type H+-ATPase subunit H
LFIKIGGDDMTNKSNNLYLQHWGIKGMKWGVRKDPETSEERMNRYKNDSEVKIEALKNKRQKSIASSKLKAEEYRAKAKDKARKTNAKVILTIGVGALYASKQILDKIFTHRENMASIKSNPVTETIHTFAEYVPASNDGK